MSLARDTHGMRISMSRKGNPYANAIAESFFKTLKGEEMCLMDVPTYGELGMQFPKDIDQRWRRVQIVLRADSGFAREEIMSWCEEDDVDYVFGLAKNSRLIRKIRRELRRARRRFGRTGRAAQLFRDFYYRTRDSWSRSRRLVGKAEYLEKGSNPRFVVTSLTGETRALYKDIHCARGDMENRIKEQQLDLFADRTIAASMRSNQLRLCFSSFAYVLLEYLRRVGLRGTELWPERSAERLG